MHRKVLVFIVNDSKETLLLQVVPKRGATWQPVTGSVDEGESDLDAAARELTEETGLQEKVQPLKTEHRFTDRFQRDVVETTFWVKVKGRPDIKIDPKEHTDCRWFAWSDLDETSFAHPHHSAVFEEVKKLCS